jgi:ATP phosphoribosyltransferase regulatory subunit
VSGQQEAMAAALAHFGRAGYLRAEPAVLQPADLFVDLSGEDMRGRMFVTQDAEGRDWCLRPEFTIPVARDCLGAGLPLPAAFSYAGPVFRLRTGESGEFAQTGLESFGRADAAAADAEIFALTLEALALLGCRLPVLRMGDVALLSGLLDALAVPAAARRRLMRAVSQGRGADAVTALTPPDSARGNDHAGLLAALEGQDPKAAKAFVEDVLSIAGISSVGGRSARDIAERFLARAAERENAPGDEVEQVLRQALAITGDPDNAVADLRAVCDAAGLDLSRALDSFEQRTGFLASRGVDVSSIQFATAFARNLDYYTGFIFEMHDPQAKIAKPLAGGGRYDGLLQRLGAKAPVLAVGASIWLDRVATAGARS